MTNPKAPTRKMTYQEFLDWCDEDTWAEWVDGEVLAQIAGMDPEIAKAFEQGLTGTD